MALIRPAADAYVEWADRRGGLMVNLLFLFSLFSFFLFFLFFFALSFSPVFCPPDSMKNLPTLGNFFVLSGH